MAKKIKEIRNMLVEKEIDAVLIKNSVVKRWMNTLTGSGCQILITRNNQYIILDGRYVEEARELEHNLEIILVNPHLNGETHNSAIKRLIDEEGLNSLAIEEDQFTYNQYIEISKLGFEIHLLTNEFPLLRLIKNQDDISIIKEGMEITNTIYEKVVSHIKLGITENEIAGYIHYYAFKYGAQKMSFDVIVTSGYRTAYPHGRPTEKKIEIGDPIMIDFGIQYKNYQSDITRMCFMGQPDEKIVEMYNVCKEAQQKGIDAIKPGVLASDVDKAARKVIEDAGYGEFFNHGLGHGMGIGEGGELPTLNQTCSIILEEGMFMSCEPGIYVPNVGGIRIEDAIIIINGVGVPQNNISKEMRIL